MDDSLIILKEPEDWAKLPERKLTVVLDPMIHRTAELFFRGAAAVSNPEAVWQRLRANLDSLATFVDGVILNEKLPLFDYAVTFSSPTLMKAFNTAKNTVLVDVNVDAKARKDITKAAWAVVDRQDAVPPHVAKKIEEELDTYNYDWRPTRPPMEDVNEEGQEVDTMRAFMYGGLLFQGYAQRLDGEHHIQSKRVQLYLRGVLRENIRRQRRLEDVFSDLMMLARRRPGGEVDDKASWHRLPTFLPYILLDKNIRTSQGLLHAIVKLREREDVRAYATWWRELRNDIKEGRRPRREPPELDLNLERRIHIESPPRASLVVARVQQPAFLASTGRREQETDHPSSMALWLPGVGRGYLNVLSDLIMADRRYEFPEMRLKKIWHSHP